VSDRRRDLEDVFVGSAEAASARFERRVQPQACGKMSEVRDRAHLRSRRVFDGVIEVGAATRSADRAERAAEYVTDGILPPTLPPDSPHRNTASVQHGKRTREESTLSDHLGDPSVVEIANLDLHVRARDLQRRAEFDSVCVFESLIESSPEGQGHEDKRVPLQEIARDLAINVEACATSQLRYRQPLWVSHLVPRTIR
jgi:hypothetical protein